MRGLKCIQRDKGDEDLFTATPQAPNQQEYMFDTRMFSLIASIRRRWLNAISSSRRARYSMRGVTSIRRISFSVGRLTFD